MGFYQDRSDNPGSAVFIGTRILTLAFKETEIFLITSWTWLYCQEKGHIGLSSNTQSFVLLGQADAWCISFYFSLFSRSGKRLLPSIHSFLRNAVAFGLLQENYRCHYFPVTFDIILGPIVDLLPAVMIVKIEGCATPRDTDLVSRITS